MKHLLAIFVIGVSVFLFACSGKEISPSQKTATEVPKTAEAYFNNLQ